jgi:hypothetical protein
VDRGCSLYPVKGQLEKFLEAVRRLLADGGVSYIAGIVSPLSLLAFRTEKSTTWSSPTSLCDGYDEGMPAAVARVKSYLNAAVREANFRSWKLVGEDARFTK